MPRTVVHAKDELSTKIVATLKSYHSMYTVNVLGSDLSGLIKIPPQPLTHNLVDFRCWSALTGYYERLRGASPQVYIVPTAVFREWSASNAKTHQPKTFASPLSFKYAILPASLPPSPLPKRGKAIEQWFLIVVVNGSSLRFLPHSPEAQNAPPAHVIVLDLYADRPRSDFEKSFRKLLVAMTRPDGQEDGFVPDKRAVAHIPFHYPMVGAQWIAL